MWLRAAIAAVAIGVVGLWLYSRGGATSAPQRPGASGGAGPRGAGAERVVPVQLAAVQREDVPVWIEGLGTVAAFQQVTVHPMVDGRLDHVLFVEGQAVHKGEVIAQIDPRPYLVQLHQAEGARVRDQTQLDIANKNVARYDDLRKQNLVAQQQVDQYLAQQGQLEGAVEIDQAQIESAKLNLDYAAVKSPLDGVTGVRLVDEGNVVHTADPTGLVVITAVNPAAVFFTVPQDALPEVSAALAKGDVPVKVLNRDGTQELGQGTVKVLDNEINPATATLRLKALVDNPDRRLWPNEFVKARMLVETRRGAIVVPAAAVQQGPSGAYVYVVGADDTAQLRPVAVALTTDDHAVIAKGVQPGEQVVVEGANQLRPGGKVQPPQARSAAPHGKP